MTLLSTSTKLSPVRKLLLEIVRHPRRFDGVVSLPLRFDAAQMLLESWNELAEKDKLRVQNILLRSGKYQPGK